MHKYADSKNLLLQEQVISPDHITDPGLVSLEDLGRVHTASYIESIEQGMLDKRALRRLGFDWSKQLYIRSRAAVNGTIKASLQALDDGIAANLAGGTHHAFADCGEGYCVFNDVAVASFKLQSQFADIKILIIDLDAHQGNGTNAIMQSEPWVYTYSMHVGSNYPSRKHPGTLDLPLQKMVTGDTYLALLEETLPRSLEDFRPDFCFYLAGVDVHKDDRFGQMALTTGEMAQRDRFVIELIKDADKPLAIVYGGGYNRDPAMTTKLHAQTIRLAAESR